jgi:hypothetical protein
MLRVKIATDSALSVFAFDVAVVFWENCVPLSKPDHICQLVSWLSNGYLGWDSDGFSFLGTKQKATRTNSSMLGHL